MGLSRLAGATVVGLAAALVTAVPAQASEGDQVVCEVTSWDISWGVKESFRAYLSGAIAGGEWTTEGEVSYDTPLFAIRGTQGVLAPDLSSGELTTEGSMRFFGHDGLLDQTLSAPTLRLNPDSLAVVFDIAGDTQEGVSVDSAAVEFVTVDISDATVDAEAGTWQVLDASTVLTKSGADAFGTYPAGEPFDPIDIRIQVEPGCLQPASTTGVFLGIALGSLLTAALAIIAVRRWRGPRPQSPAES